MRKEAENYFASFDLYTYMAHYVGRVLKVRPNEIMDTWGVAELIVAFGQYANEDSYRNYSEWESVHGSRKKTQKKPEKYVVVFMPPDQLSDE